MVSLVITGFFRKHEHIDLNSIKRPGFKAADRLTGTDCSSAVVAAAATAASPFLHAVAQSVSQQVFNSSQIRLDCHHDQLPLFSWPKTNSILFFFIFPKTSMIDSTMIIE